MYSKKNLVSKKKKVRRNVTILKMIKKKCSLKDSFKLKVKIIAKIKAQF